jgi:cell division protein FtsL
VTGKIYHVKNFPPENEEISSRLIMRSDDTFEKVLLLSIILTHCLFSIFIIIPTAQEVVAL